MPFRTEDEAKARGAVFVKAFPFRTHTIRDGQLITGQNPMSGRAVAKTLMAAIIGQA